MWNEENNTILITIILSITNTTANQIIIKNK